MVIYYLYPQHNLNRHVVVIFSWHETVHNTAVKGKVQSSLDLPFPCNPSIITLCHKEKKRKRIQTKIVKKMYIVTDCPWILTSGMDSVILKSQIGKEE